MDFDFSLLKKSIGDLAGGLTSKRVEIEDLKQQRQALAKAPGTRDDVLDLILQEMDSQADGYVANLQASISFMQYGVHRHMGKNSKHQVIRVATAPEHVNTPPVIDDIEAALCYVIRPQMRAAATKALQAMEWPAGAEPLKGRAARLAKLDKRIGELENEARILREEAAKAGILV